MEANRAGTDAPVPPLPGELSRLPAALRPHRHLLLYYALQSLVLGPFAPVLLLPRYFRYHTLRYDFDNEGVTMRWGILFRRETSLTYARVQDIHLVSNVVERWLGLARIQVQTASGSAGAEMTIEGRQDFGEIRDFLYSRMRGARTAMTDHAPAGVDDPLHRAAEALQAAAAELRAVREMVGPGPRSEG
jgi:putative membrane protein